MNRLLRVVCGCLVLSFAAFAVAADPVAPSCPVKVVLPIAHDADTIRGSLSFGWNVWLHDQELRAYGYDAYEVTKTRQTVEVTDEEIVKGKAAKYALIDLLEHGDLYAEDSGQKDPYGRTSAILWVKPKDPKDGAWIYLAAWMEQKGFLRTPRNK